MFFNTNTHSNIIYPSFTLFMGTTSVFTYLHTYLWKYLSYVPTTYSYDNIWIPQILPWFPCKRVKIRVFSVKEKIVVIARLGQGKRRHGLRLRLRSLASMKKLLYLWGEVGRGKTKCRKSHDDGIHEGISTILVNKGWCVQCNSKK
jgi:hypothetical protein